VGYILILNLKESFRVTRSVGRVLLLLLLL